MHLVFGARQTGKSTLLLKVLPETAIWLDFSRPAEHAEYLRNPDLLVQRCQALRSLPLLIAPICCAPTR